MSGGGWFLDARNAEHTARQLARAGFSPGRVVEIRRYLLRCVEALQELDASDALPRFAAVVPGRIEVLGKHTDYAGGRSLIAAADRGFTTVAVPRSDNRVRVLDLAKRETVDFRLDPELEPASGWANYPMTVARRIARNFPTARTGADLAFISDLPAAAGMSSSSALITAVFLSLSAVNHLETSELYRSNIQTLEDLAAYLSTVENGDDFRMLKGDTGVGTRGGSEDHTAILCARPGHLVQYAFAPVRFERAVPLPPGYSFMIGNSGVQAEKTGAARERYNRAAELMRTAADLWRAETGGSEPNIGAVLDADPAAADRLRAMLSFARHPRFSAEALLSRVDQFIAEDREIIPAAGDALQGGDLAAFGALVDRSQALAERLLGNQIEETIHLARSARAGGAIAASAFGAGFGGSVWAWVEDAGADEFQARWRADYTARFPDHAADALFFRTQSGPPAIRLP